MRSEQLPHRPLAMFTVCHGENALVPFVLVKPEEPCHKSETFFLVSWKLCGAAAQDKYVDWKPIETFEGLLINDIPRSTRCSACIAKCYGNVCGWFSTLRHMHRHTLKMNVKVSVAKNTPRVLTTKHLHYYFTYCNMHKAIVCFCFVGVSFYWKLYLEFGL